MKRRALTVLAGGLLIAALGGTGASGAAAAETGPSVILSSDGPANLRPCPHVPAQGVSTGECAAIGRLPSGTRVQMQCWIDGDPPRQGQSPRWFWVSVLDGDMAGHAGFVWADLVDPVTQTRTDPCRSDWWNLSDPAAPSIDTRVTVEAGPLAPVGRRYAITLSGFTPNVAVSVACFDSVDQATPFYTFSLVTDGNGAAFTAGQCYSADGPNYWVEAGGITSNIATW